MAIGLTGGRNDIDATSTLNERGKGQHRSAARKGWCRDCRQGNLCKCHRHARHIQNGVAALRALLPGLHARVGGLSMNLQPETVESAMHCGNLRVAWLPHDHPITVQPSLVQQIARARGRAGTALFIHHKRQRQMTGYSDVCCMERMYCVDKGSDLSLGVSCSNPIEPSLLLCWLRVVSVGQNWPGRTSHNDSCSLPIPHHKNTISSIKSLIFTKGNGYRAEDSQLHHVVDSVWASVAQRPLRRLETSPPHCSAGDAPARAASGLQALLEIQVQSQVCHTQDLR